MGPRGNMATTDMGSRGNMATTDMGSRGDMATTDMEEGAHINVLIMDVSTTRWDFCCIQVGTHGIGIKIEPAFHKLQQLNLLN